MEIPPLTYFTCTLDQAAATNARDPHDFETISDFIDLQASLYPDSPALGFPVPSDKQLQEWGFRLFSFALLKHGSVAAAEVFAHSISRYGDEAEQRCVALICPSSVDFIFSWLGLMRSGFSVLLIAPQCQPEAVAHLCSSCNVSTIFYDVSYAKLAGETADVAAAPLAIEQLPWQKGEASLSKLIDSALDEDNYKPLYSLTSSSVAYIHHTSGTSTGLPKPIPQTHRAGCGVLPCLDGSSAATCTTTPLYHGGIADCFRAWTSGALIWLFPGASAPITARNIISSLRAAQDAANADPVRTAQVKYFSSVPYILQMLAEDEEGLDWLTRMDVVGVGGAALPESVGDLLVSKGVNLISRFGSAECGFLLSSHRDYPNDAEWQFLRVPIESQHLHMERKVDGTGLSELIVRKDWPHMAKTNRGDGSFATSDLFEPHATIDGAWKYHSRSDSQITLITGKKFDPAPLEDAIVADVDFIRDMLVFGNGEQMPGAIVFVSKDAGEEAEALEEKMWSVVNAMNEKGQDHTRISREMIVILRTGTLEKSSKGTVLRAAAEKTFRAEIRSVYDSHGQQPEASRNESAGSDAKTIVQDAVQQVLGRSLTDDEDFYRSGVDSTAATRIRGIIGKNLAREKPLPWNVVFDTGSISSLAQFLSSDTETDKMASGINEAGALAMLNAVEVLSNVEQGVINGSQQVESSDGHVVVLTGATGSLGPHILASLLNNPTVNLVVCFVRAKDAAEARDRVIGSLRLRRLLPSPQILHDKLACVRADFEQVGLGVNKATYDDLRSRTTLIIHAAWMVNFVMRMEDFLPAFQTTRNLLDLAVTCHHCCQFVFCSSTASVLGPHHNDYITELLSTSPFDADTLGYSRSKWVAEAICARVAEQTRMTRKVKILRIGQLTGDTVDGIWNLTEAYPLILSTVYPLKCLPKLPDKLNWLPLDIAAKAVVEISLTATNCTDHQVKEYSVANRHQFYHVLNKNSDTHFGNLLTWLKYVRQVEFDIVDPQVWLERLKLLDHHPAKALIGLWDDAYGSQGNEVATKKTEFKILHAEKESAAMRDVGPMDELLFGRIWSWLEGEISRGANDQG